MDYACQYSRAMLTSSITSSLYDTTSRTLTTTFSGKTDLPTEYYLFTEQAGNIQEQLLNGSFGVPVFNGSTSVTFTLAGALDHITVTPNPASLVAGATQQFTAQGYDASNNPLPNLTYTWSVANGGGSITSGGLFTAGSTPGTFANTVVATVGSISGAATVNIAQAVLDHFSFDTIPSPQYAGVPFRITVTARDAAGNLVLGFNGSVTLSASSGTLTPTSSGSFSGGSWTGYVTINPTANGVTLRATDGVHNGVSNSFNVATLPACPCTIWAPSATPASASVTDGIPIEVGVKFRADIDGYVTGVRFYKGSLNTGTHTGHLWSRDGALLAEVQFSGETASGWNRRLLPRRFRLPPTPLTLHHISRPVGISP